MLRYIAIASAIIGSSLPANAETGQLITTNLDVGLYSNSVASSSSVGSLNIRFLPGSLAEHITTNLLTRMKGRRLPSAMDMFNSQRHETTNIVRNPDFWLADFPQTTAYNAVRSYGLSFGLKSQYCPNATLLTRRHFLQAKHNRVPTNWGVVYVSRENQRIVRRAIDWEPLTRVGTNVVTEIADSLIIQLLNEAVPHGFVPLRLLPPDIGDYLGEFAPLVAGHHTKTFGIMQYGSAPFAVRGIYTGFFPLGSNLPDWYVPGGAGDSGSTSEYVINGHLVLGLRNTVEIVSAIKALNARHGTTEMPELIDLSGFPKLR